MLASLTPLGERGRHNRYAVTVVAFLIGAALAGAGLGAAVGGLGALLLGSVSSSVRLAGIALALLIAVGFDLRSGRIPGPRRQVNERWRDEFRGWVYGAGYGVQLGLAVVTVISSAATYATLLAALLAADPGTGAVILGLYGSIRGLTPLLAGTVRTPAQLHSLHRALAAGEVYARRGGQLLLLAAGVLALAGALG